MERFGITEGSLGAEWVPQLVEKGVISGVIHVVSQVKILIDERVTASVEVTVFQCEDIDALP